MHDGLLLVSGVSRAPMPLSGIWDDGTTAAPRAVMVEDRIAGGIGDNRADAGVVHRGEGAELACLHLLLVEDS